MLVYQSNPVGVKLLSYENTLILLGLCFIFCAQKSRPARWTIHISKCPRTKQKGTKHAAKLQLLYVRTKSHSWTYVYKDFKCNLSATVHSKLSQHLKESTLTKMKMTSFAPEDFFWGGGQIRVPRYIQENSIFFHYPITTAFCQTQEALHIPLQYGLPFAGPPV